jgi:hypothetical protein
MFSMATEQVTLVIIPALIMGGIIGLIELFFVHADEIGMGWFMHGLHALPATMFFTFVSMNMAWVHKMLPALASTFWMDMGIRAAIAIIAMFKIQAAAAIAGRVGERIHHTIIIGCLIFASPYIWMVLAPLFAPLLNTGAKAKR